MSGHASRSLRALVGAAFVLVFFSIARLLRPAPPRVRPPTQPDLERAGAVVAAALPSLAHLALIGDKQLLFHENASGFVMYGAQRRSWVSMGDPVGAPEGSGARQRATTG